MNLHVVVDREHVTSEEHVRIFVSTDEHLAANYPLRVDLVPAFMTVGSEDRVLADGTAPMLQIEAPQLWLSNGRAEFEARICFSEQLSDACAVLRLRAVAELGQGEIRTGRSATIKLCKYEVAFIDLTRVDSNEHQITYAATCVLSWRCAGRQPGACAGKSLRVSLLGPDNREMGFEGWQLRCADGRVVTDGDGRASFAICIGRAIAHAGFRICVASDWLESRELRGTKPAVSRPLSAKDDEFPQPGDFAPAVECAAPADVAMQPSNVDRLEWLRRYEWIEIDDDQIVMCPCCRAIKSKSKSDRITHRKACQFNPMLAAIHAVGREPGAG
ncbi:hypothetical protein M885DRAFT_623037 [Pelagophyceae sp. CCMP2097]|nr:hypothetical protein M885DRAFT_623037 [Pelagophyceae sp. CCMP2097]